MRSPESFLIFILFTLSLAEDRGRRRDKESDDKKKKEELILVHAHWRHGKTGVDAMTAAETATRTFDPDAMTILFDLGLLLQRRYVKEAKFIDPDKFEDSAYFRSSDNLRSLTGIQAVQAGLCPSSEKVYRKVEGWPPDWEPIAVHTVPMCQDYILDPVQNCVPYYRAQAEAVKRYIRRSRKEERETYNRLIERTGLPNGTSADDLYRLVFQISDFEPLWARQGKDKVLNTLAVMAKEEAKEYGKDKDMLRLRAGPMLQEIVNRMKAKIEALKTNVTAETKFVRNLRLYAYAASRDQISSVNEDFWQLSVLTDRPTDSDQALSSILYELWRIGKKYYVKLFYCQKCDEKNDYKPIQVNGCPNATHYCPIELFENALQPYSGINSLQERNQACAVASVQADQATPLPKSPEKEDFSVLAIVFGIVVGILAIVCINLFYVILTQTKEADDSYVMVDERSSLLGK